MPFTYGINQAITAALYKKLPYNHLRDFTLISLYATMPNILCVTPSLSVASVPEFIKFAKTTVWQGYPVPKGTPQPFVSKIHAAMMKALAVPELKQRFFENGVAAAPMMPEEFTIQTFQ